MRVKKVMNKVMDKIFALLYRNRCLLYYVGITECDKSIFTQKQLISINKIKFI